MSGPPLAEVDAAFRRYWLVGAIDERWTDWTDLFTEDVIYTEHVYGVMHGRQAVQAWIVPLMDRNPHIHAVLDWYMIEGDRVVLRMLNRYYSPEPGGAPFDFPGMTILRYAGAGRFDREEDWWSLEEAQEAYGLFTAARVQFGDAGLVETPARRRARLPPGWSEDTALPR